MTGIAGLAEQLGVQPVVIVAASFALGILLLAGAVIMILRDRKRMAALRRIRAAQPQNIKLVLDIDAEGGGLLDRVFVPNSVQERSRLRRDLAHAGFRSPDAALTFNLIRFGVGLGLPMAIALVYLFPTRIPAAVLAYIPHLQMAQVMVICGLIILVGFYGPGIWLSGRAADRRLRIENSFPNALDLLQVGVESGLAFDAALSRVGEEMRASAPEVCEEFQVVQTEILAGRDREAAYRDMADRLGIDEAFGFVNVVTQSMRFGTSMSSALLTYSAEMRQRREMRAQEKANRLPVLMSAVMAGFMMPALLIVTIGPVALRYVETNLTMP